MEFDDDPTDLDGYVLDPDTDKHHSLDYLAGREAGFSEGVEAAIAALRYELSRAGVVGNELEKISGRIKLVALEKG